MRVSTTTTTEVGLRRRVDLSMPLLHLSRDHLACVCGQGGRERGVPHQFWHLRQPSAHHRQSPPHPIITLPPRLPSFSHVQRGGVLPCSPVLPLPRPPCTPVHLHVNCFLVNPRPVCVSFTSSPPPTLRGTRAIGYDAQRTSAYTHTNTYTYTQTCARDAAGAARVRRAALHHSPTPPRTRRLVPRHAPMPREPSRCCHAAPALHNFHDAAPCAVHLHASSAGLEPVRAVARPSRFVRHE